MHNGKHIIAINTAIVNTIIGIIIGIVTNVIIDIINCKGMQIRACVV